MPARVLSISPTDPRQDRVEEALGVLRAGGIVALPTETFYGLAVGAFDAEAVSRLNRVKRKPPGSPTLLLLAGPAQVARVSAELPECFDRISEKFWPGPLTLIVPASPELPPGVTDERGTVGFRVPGSALARRIAAELGSPITGISANLHGQPPCRTALAVDRAFPDGVELILDGGPTPGGAPSTLLDLSCSPPRVLREGAVPVSSLSAFLPGLE